MQPELLGLPDRALAERMHVLEGQTDGTDPLFEKYRQFHAMQSREAWQALTEELDCDRGPLAELGVMSFPLGANARASQIVL